MRRSIVTGGTGIGVKSRQEIVSNTVAECSTAQRQAGTGMGEAATELHNDQMFYSLAATDYARHPQWLSQYADAVVKNSDSSIYGIYANSDNPVRGAGASGATGALGYLVSAKTGSIGSTGRFQRLGPVVTGNAFGVGATELTNLLANGLGSSSLDQEKRQ